jgi:NADH-quinone oxidoreductase subunit L
VISGLKSIRWAAENSFGFEAINNAVVKVTESTAEGLRTTQTGILGWNVFGIVASIIILFAILILGA